MYVYHVSISAGCKNGEGHSKTRIQHQRAEPSTPLRFKSGIWDHPEV